MGHKIEGEKFRPICGQLLKESSLLCTQSKIEAKRPKQRFLAGRAVGCDFPNFWDFTKKIQVERNFLTYFWQVLAFRLPSYKQTKKKHYLTLRGSQEPTIDFHITKLVPKKFFIQKLQNIPRTAIFKLSQGGIFLIEVGWFLTLFDPLCPNPLP